MRHTNQEIASDFALWSEYFACGVSLPREVMFDPLTVEERVRILEECFGPDDEDAMTRVLVSKDGGRATACDLHEASGDWYVDEMVTDDEVDNLCVLSEIGESVRRGMRSGSVPLKGASFEWAVAQ